jgi:hypothetical protein
VLGKAGLGVGRRHQTAEVWPIGRGQPAVARQYPRKVCVATLSHSSIQGTDCCNYFVLLMLLGTACIWSSRRAVTHRVVDSATALWPSCSLRFIHHHVRKHHHLNLNFQTSCPASSSHLYTMATPPTELPTWPAHKVRETFLTYFKNLGHTIGRFRAGCQWFETDRSTVPSSSVVPLNDPTLLFANAGT